MKGKGALAILLNKPLEDDTEEDAPDSSRESASSREYFDAFVSALRDEDDDTAFDAFKDLMSACKDD